MGALLARFVPSLVPGLGAFLNPWVLLIIAAVAIGLYGWGRHDGAAITSAAWERREAGINAKTAERIQGLNALNRQLEQLHAQDLARISAAYQDQLRKHDNEKDRALAALRARTLQLSIPARCPAGGSGSSEAPAGAGGRDAAARAELSPEAAGFLIGEATRADKIVDQLTACQAIVNRDRRPP
jgi:hypothetical protein